MSTPIEFADIKAGDTIKACGISDGVAMDRQGVVDKAEVRQGARTISTPENGWIYHSHWSGDWFFELIERPEPELPTEPGSVILASKIKDWVPDHEPTYMSLTILEQWRPLTSWSQKALRPEDIEEWVPVKLVPQIEVCP